MTLASLTIADLKRIGKLLTRKEALLARVRKLDQRLAAYESGPSVAAVPRAIRRRRKNRRGLKNDIIGLLTKAGKEGMAVQTIADKVHLKPSRIYTWFYGTGRNIKQIKKISAAKYRWDA